MCNHVPKCGIAATVKDGKIVRVESRDKYPASPICAKGLASLQELYDPHRLTAPMVRTNEKGTGTPEWKEIAWEEAYERIASEFNRVKEEYGPEKVLFYCGDPKEPRGAMARVATLFGSPCYGAESSTCAAATWISAWLTMGALSMGTDPGDATASALVWSLNPAWSQPYRFGQMMKHKERGCKFVVVDPRITPTVTGLADIHLQLRPGTDGALAAGFLHVMFRDGMYDKDFAENWTHGLPELQAYVEEYTPERVEENDRRPGREARGRRQTHLRERPLDPGQLLGRRLPRHQRGQLPARGVPDHLAHGQPRRARRHGHLARPALRLHRHHGRPAPRGALRGEEPL